MRQSFVFILCALLSGCQQQKTEKRISEHPAHHTTLNYAVGFKVSYIGKTKRVEVMYPFQGATAGYTYLLVPHGEEIPEHDATIRVIRIPVKSMVCTSTTHIPLLDYLDETETLTGFPGTDYISSEKMRERIDNGKIIELGVEKGINLERLTVLKPDLVMGYSMSNDYGQFKKLEELGIPVVLNSEYLEKHPLGRAEWIKFMALFFDKERMADSVFSIIEKNYLEAKAIPHPKKKPTIMSGIVYGDAWFMPGGQNYNSKLLQDAGCQYLWEGDSSSGFLELSFESVYEKANQAEFWIGVGNYPSLEAIRNADHRYAKFKAFNTKNVYTYDGRRGAKGGSEFLELGYLRPDIILRDLIKITQPDAQPDHEMYFYKKLE
ncbi:MAG: ABC transporter substrate-binding protein [Cyclobacteriaceae bacterium]|nr:ABC transporter substrate-binding protein [Cyclobacteriaceae bacterium]